MFGDDEVGGGEDFRTSTGVYTMKKASWLLFVLSIVILLFGAISRFTPNGIVNGVAAGTYWKAAMALLAYAATIKILTLEPR